MASSSRSNTIYLKLYLRRRSGVTDGIESAVYGMVDHRYAEDPESELRTLIAVPDKDQQAARNAWLKWFEEAVEEGKRAAAERGISIATLRTEIEEDNEIGWFNNYFKNYAEDTIKVLQKKGILVPLRTRA
jgi:hypothetical protein